ncbi:PIN domain-containing protein [Pedobacter aquatilis]|uniref:type II toxin-antitoxin system VapC family toxin n=1 Tax=Pedobacter aquatilis TaxID=351343 RepID=UPI0025B3C0E6|nr:PIN domain-containing protein [Pedobacter aquatilis]MDN3585314.1 PIN domain-containing protein [Pedobacter aquatilis]
MLRIFLDANVLVSVLNKEYPLFTYSSRILSLASHPKFEVYTSPLCLAIAFYFAEKKHSSAVAKQKIDLLCQHVKIAENSSKGVADILTNKKIHDFEDGLEYYAAQQKDCKCIITENIEDFYFLDIEVLNCQDFFKRYLLN